MSNLRDRPSGPVDQLMSSEFLGGEFQEEENEEDEKKVLIREKQNIPTKNMFEKKEELWTEMYSYH